MDHGVIPIPFPPETEQEEIVRRLEVQLGKVEALQQELGGGPRRRLSC